jgi:type VI secretion system Hcp family effector
MAIDPYVMVEKFEGGSVKNGHPKNSSLLFNFTHVVSTPIDPVAGHVTNRRHHELIVADILIDASMYQYYQGIIDKDQDAATKGKFKVEFGFFRTNQPNLGADGSGESAPYLKINLENAFIAHVEFIAGDTRETTGPQAGAGRNEMIRVKFAYDKIMWTYTKGGKSAQDSWGGK